MNEERLPKMLFGELQKSMSWDKNQVSNDLQAIGLKDDCGKGCVRIGQNGVSVVKEEWIK